MDPPRSVGEQRRLIQDIRSKTVTFTDGLAGALEQRIHRLKRMPTPFWERKDVKPPAEGDDQDQTPNSDSGGGGVGAGPEAGRQLSVICDGRSDSSTAASGRNSSEATPTADSSTGSNPTRSLSVRTKGGGTIDRSPSPQNRKCSLPACVVTRRYTGDGLLVIPTEHSVDHLA